ncbi:hypothetical protein GQ55_5G088300 [Panicum hallii var. hallii]|uniref:Uncharacterized protein n=1 Tax=Panicum hallii var. hallii TaxID=1504633 RepID=A0A2T7DEA1_9POAL|nr:hypothetical protein GQ55_5G088300 [Panicum hallii var. hallii]
MRGNGSVQDLGHGAVDRWSGRVAARHSALTGARGVVGKSMAAACISLASSLLLFPEFQCGRAWGWRSMKWRRSEQQRRRVRALRRPEHRGVGFGELGAAAWTATATVM